jgi:hypothetical protein
MPSENRFVLRVLLDASRVPDFHPDCRVKVLAWVKQGPQQQQLVKFSREGKGAVRFEFEARPQEAVRVALGPASATPFELQRLQTISVNVPATEWNSKSDITLPAIQITPYHWWWWQHWRQSFKVTGRAVSSRGVPIIGATVSAFDVDAWWWWTAQERVGEATTDEDGAFAIEFTRASGWWPWWWWVTREWQINAELVGRITAFVGQYAKFGSLPGPTPAPSLEVFQPLLAASPRPRPLRLIGNGQGIGNGAMDPASLEGLRERLVEILPRNFALPVWPWSTWAPWEDCGANLTFRVTDKCGDETTVLLNESVSDARWEIPSALDVTLTTRDVAFRERRPGWSLVDYLFPGKRPEFPDHTANDGAATVLATPA